MQGETVLDEEVIDASAARTRWSWGAQDGRRAGGVA